MDIVVVLYNSAPAVRVLLACLQAQTFAAWRLILIDNGITDDAGSWAAGLGDPRVTVLTNRRNEGFSRAVNQSLRVSLADGAERILLLNPDVSFAPEFLARLDAQWTAYAAMVIVPRIMLSERPDTAWYAGGSFEEDYIFGNVHEPWVPGGPPARLVGFASGCCLGLTREVIQIVGLLDESFFVYWEDTDWCLRLRSRGLAIQYVTEPMLLHDGGASSGGEKSPAAQRLYYKSYAQLLKKHFGLIHTLRTIGRVLLKLRGNRDAGRRGALIGLAFLRGLLSRRRPLPALSPETPDLPAAGPGNIPASQG